MRKRIVETVAKYLPSFQHQLFAVLTNDIPSSSSDGVSSQPTTRRRVTDDSEPRDWVVDIIDERQVIKSIRLKVQDVHNLENGSRIIVECDEFAQPIGKSAGLLAGFLGQLATNPRYFPIGSVSSKLTYIIFVKSRFFFMCDPQKERIEEIRRQRPKTLAEISPNDALGVVFGLEHPGCVRGLGMGAVPTLVFKQTSRRGGCSYMGAASTSAPPPQWVQEMANMRLQLNALTSLFQMKIENIPEEFAHLFPPPSQTPNLGDGVPSPTGPRRSFDGSNYENGSNNN
ncbi:uncharacterized protein LOC142174448 [Nicotiana tabacum]|uniref:Uncharacterized protein LOC142174448 n=1 Tax=Nicotiana tabacum TaxID=4097 RepID=A0AC58TGJ5_TOBAC